MPGSDDDLPAGVCHLPQPGVCEIHTLGHLFSKLDVHRRRPRLRVRRPSSVVGIRHAQCACVCVSRHVLSPSPIAALPFLAAP